MDVGSARRLQFLHVPLLNERVCGPTTTQTALYT